MSADERAPAAVGRGPIAGMAGNAAATSALRGNVAAAAAALLTSSGTLVCCALPALFVALGAGAALAGLVGAIPQLVWLSLHKAWVFGAAGALLVLAGALQWRARSLPCPADAALARQCARLRRIGHGVYAASVVVYALGAAYAFAVPALMGG
ncbi:MAG: hypothetical protein ACK52I_13040 [Pseudomonadota bacterium]